MRIFSLVLLALLGILNYHLWLSQDRGVAKVLLLKGAIESQKADNAALAERNSTLEAEVTSLKEGVEALEERARIELGMVRKGETFFHILDKTSTAIIREQSPSHHHK